MKEHEKLSARLSGTAAVQGPRPSTAGQAGSYGDGQTPAGRNQDVVLCKRPFRKAVMEFGCGQCLPCRINRQRTWVARLQLELLKSPFSCFVTLTYNDDHLPKNGHLNKRHAQLWLKRLREKITPRTLRYFLVGEYGERTWRPHYHAIIYGVDSAESSLISSTWTLGFVLVGTAEPASMSYVSGYVTKKMTKATDSRLEGRPPEFCLMSRRPGIGLCAVDNLAAAYRSSRGQAALKRDGWISTSVQIGTKKYPMGRYLSGKLVGQLGLSDEERKAYNWRRVVETWQKKSVSSTTEYEKSRKAKVSQQEGRLKIATGKWRKTL